MDGIAELAGLAAGGGLGALIKHWLTRKSAAAAKKAAAENRQVVEQRLVDDILQELQNELDFLRTQIARLGVGAADPTAVALADRTAQLERSYERLLARVRQTFKYLPDVEAASIPSAPPI